MARPSLPLTAVLLAGVLTGCGYVVVPPGPFVAFGAIDLVTIAATKHDVFDIAWSAITGRDCSIVRLDSGDSYCKPVDPRPPIPPFCTRSIGTIDCWTSRAVLFDAAPGIADGPASLTPAQEANRTARWP